MKAVKIILAIAAVILFWIFITPMLFAHGSSSAFQMGVASIPLGIAFIGLIASVTE